MGMKEVDLKLITPVKHLLDFERDADIKVFPPHSAKSDTKVHIDSSYEALLNRMKDELAGSVDAIADRKIQKSLNEGRNEVRKGVFQLPVDANVVCYVLHIISTSVNERDIKT
jgi:predicted transcriptional regulator YheO